MGRRTRRQAPDTGGILSSRKEKPKEREGGARASLEGAIPWEWRPFGRGSTGAPLEEGFFREKTEWVAKALLGCRLRSSVEGRVTEGVIVETEA